jgi:predicted nicotinamide N-methyase
VWDAAVFLSRFLEGHSSHVRGKNVLELGAGDGLSGIKCQWQASHTVAAVIFFITRSKPKFSAGLGLCSIAAGMLGAKSVVATDLRRVPWLPLRNF